MDDIVDEVHDDTVRRHELFTEHGSITYTTKTKHAYWGRDDEYKVIDV